LRIDTGEPLRILPGHGKGINDLAVSPLSTNLIASASEDYTIRLWNLHPKFDKQPCVAMFCGEGHKQPVLATSFHPNGRWMLSGGLDTAVCLWSVPAPAELDKTEEELQDHNEPRTIYYPQFYSTEVHHNYVDCLQFYGDLILSRASKDQNDRSKSNEILLWKIDGFDPNEPAPKNPPIPVPDVYTRSAFPHSERSRGFQRLLTFQIMNTDRFYHRFGLLHEPGMRPILSMGNQESKFLFWDLQRLEEGSDPADEKVLKKGRKPKGGVSSENLNRLDGLKRGESIPSSDGTGGATRELTHIPTLSSRLTTRSHALLDIQFRTSRTQICSQRPLPPS
jgi:polycomb protein EED